ncbi:MAG: glycosyl hydrolase, partial [Acidobacteriota bacterium]
VQDHEDPELLFAGTEFGIYFTVDGGGRWVRLEGGVPTIAFRDIEIQRRESDLVGASFGRGLFVLDDYTPLREIGAEALEAEARLFPVRDAIRFVPSSDLGIPGRGFQGATAYMADNPPPGAIITVWIREAAETAREEREAREERLREEGDDVPFPGWDVLGQELRESDPFLLVTITDAEGNVVRRVTAPDRAGLQREEMRRLEDDLDAAGAPYTPGRGIGR